MFRVKKQCTHSVALDEFAPSIHKIIIFRLVTRGAFQPEFRLYLDPPKWQKFYHFEAPFAILNLNTNNKT